MTSLIWILQLIALTCFHDVESSKALRTLNSQLNLLRQSVTRDIENLRWDVGDLQTKLELERARTSNLEALLNATAESSAVGYEVIDVAGSATDDKDIRIKYIELNKQVDDLKEENVNLKEIVKNQSGNLSKALTAIARLEESAEQLTGSKEKSIADIKGQLENDVLDIENKVRESFRETTAVFTQAFEGEKTRLREFQEDIASKIDEQGEGLVEPKVKQMINDSIAAIVPVIKATCENIVGQLKVKVDHDIDNINATLEMVSDTQEMYTKQLKNLTTCCNRTQEVKAVHVIGTGTNWASSIPSGVAGLPTVPRAKDANYTVYAVYDEDIAKQIRIGSRVIRGKHWSWGDQDGGGPGTVFEWYQKDPSTKQVMVRWDAGRQANYRVGYLGLYDLYIITGGDADHLAGTSTLRFKPIFKADLESAITIGSRVIKGEDWSWRTQDGGGAGTVTSWYQNNKLTRQVMVDWDNAGRANYRIGAHGQYDLFLLAD